MVYYKLDFNDLELWKLKEDPQTYEKYYERAKESGSLYLKKCEPTMIDGMVCNWQDITIHKWVRMRKLGSLYIIEPSNIIVSENSLNKINKKEIKKTDPILFRNISIDTFICNYISDFTRGGVSRISEEKVGILREKFMNRGITKNNNNRTLSAVDFAFMFCSYMNNNRRYSFSRSDLMDFIFSNQDNPKYQSILGQTKVYRHEHYDVSDDLEFALAYLKYMGILHPDYEIGLAEVYESLSIDNIVISLASLFNEKRSQFPEMDEFMNNYIEHLVKNEIKLKFNKRHAII